MFHISLDVTIDAALLIPKPIKIANELDDITLPFGFERYAGERSNDYKKFVYNGCNYGFGHGQNHYEVSAIEVRSDVDKVSVETLSTSQFITKIGVTDSQRLEITKFALNTTTSFYGQTSYSYDLMNRNSYPYLEDVCGKATVDCTTVRFTLAEPGRGFRYDLAPYHLYGAQTNYAAGISYARHGTAFFLDHKMIIPNSIELVALDTSSIAYQRVGAANQITLPGHYYVDCHNGKVQCGTDFGVRDVVFRYQYTAPKSSFLCFPGVAFFAFNDNEVFKRMNATVGNNSFAQEDVQYYNSSTTTTYGTSSYIYFSNNLSMICETCQDKRKSRWA